MQINRNAFLNKKNERTGCLYLWLRFVCFSVACVETWVKIWWSLAVEQRHAANEKRLALSFDVERPLYAGTHEISRSIACWAF